MKYQLIIEDHTQSETFDTEEEAMEYASYISSRAKEGAEILHMCNPGDNPYDEDTFVAPSWYIVELED